MTIDNFKKWLVARGRTEETAQGYASDVLAAQTHPQGPLGRLRMRTLAPKTLRRTMASLRAWCKFTKDATLLEQISDIRLPPPARKIIKEPLNREQWLAVVKEINQAEYLSHPERAALGIMATRGLRVGDVLRLERAKVQEAVRTGELAYKGKGSKWIQVGVQSFKAYLELLAREEDWEYVRDLISISKKGSRQKSAGQQLSRALKQVGERVGISAADMYPHKLRRTFATAFLEAVGGDLEKLRQMMSWNDISTAAGYADHGRKNELEAIGDNLLLIKGAK